MLAAELTAPVKPELEPRTFDVLPKRPQHPPKARAMISMFMIGGPSQIDLFDRKPELIKRNGEAFSGDVKFDNPAQASREIMGPAWKFRRYGKCGMELSDLVPHLGEVADDITLIRSMHSGSNNHFPATMALYTGAPVGGRAPLGSWLLYGLGCESEQLPAFVAMTDPKGPPIRGSLEWLSGNLPAIFQGTPVRPSEPRIFNLVLLDICAGLFNMDNSNSCGNSTRNIFGSVLVKMICQPAWPVTSSRPKCSSLPVRHLMFRARRKRRCECTGSMRT